MYCDFRTGYRYRDIYEMYWSFDDNHATWKYKRRHTILGKWHQIKKDLWLTHVHYCGAQDSEEVPF